MRKNTFLSLAALVCAAAVASLACQQPLPTGGDINISNVNTNSNQQGQGGGPSASPSPGAGGSITLVKVVQFGETCPQGTSPSGEDRSVRVGCTKHLTCTPFLSDGSPAPVAVHGPAPEFFGLTAGGTSATAAQQDEAFNIDAKGIAPGIASFRCTVKGVSSLTFDLTVVAR
jgi:hypothetical protein